MFRKELFLWSLFIFVVDIVIGNRTVLDENLSKFLGTLERYMMTPNDVVFLLDESGSIGVERFPQVKLFTKLTAQRLSVSSEHSRIAVVTFATDTIDHIDYIKKTEGNMCTLLKDIDKIGYVAEWTHTDKAMLAAERMFLNARNNSNKIIVLLTDGQSNDGHSPVAIAQTLKSRGVIIFAVGVADVNVAEINAVATSPDHIYILSDFEYIKEVNKYLVDDTREISMDLEKDTSQCNTFCSEGVDCCDDHANCYCGTITGRYECACIAGYHGNGHRSECHKCPKGTYKSEAKNSICKSCPEHSTTEKEGSSSASDCKCENGYEKNGNICTAVKCALLSAPTGGILIPSHCNNTYGTQCSFKCRAGYCPFSCNANNHLPQASGQHASLPTRTCLENREWSGVEFYCEKVTCPVLQSPFGGEHNCTVKDNTYETKCHFTCDKGRELSGSEIRSCLLNGSWTGQETHCKKIHCDPLKTNNVLHVKPSNCSAKSMPYQSVCQYFCAKGYSMVSQGNDTAGVMKCEANKKWSGGYNKISCKDTTPPTIKCPSSIEINAEPHKKHAQVSWTLPEAKDNMDKPKIRIIKPEGIRKPPHYFDIGVTKVEYEAVDRESLSKSCSFLVTVIDLEPPLVISCPSDIEVYHNTNAAIPVIWEEPVFEDNSKDLNVTSTRKSGETFAWGPENRVVYIASDKSGNNVSCSFNVKVKPYACPYYPPPANGFLTCDTWADGTLCALYCKPGFEFASTKNIPTTLICKQQNKGSKVVGKWQVLKGYKLKLPWPDCSQKQKPSTLDVTMDMSFAVDSCSEEELQKMRETFVKDLKAFSSFFCPDTCTPENVNISCGSSTTRIKRSVNYNVHHTYLNDLKSNKDRFNRETQKQILSISFSMQMYPNVTSMNSDSKPSNDPEVENEIILLSSNPVIMDLENTVSKSVKDVYPQTTLLDDKVFYEVICAADQFKVNNSCVKCPSGTYKSFVAESCIECPQATYQDEEHQSSCKPCPAGYTTYDVKSRAKDDCKAPCPSGTYSETTFEPCRACPLNTYQERASRKDCMKCPSGLYTWRTGSNTSSDCVAPCKPGSYSDTGFEPCILCDVHSFQDTEKQTICNVCPNRTSTSTKGSKSIDDCKEIDICRDRHPCQNGSSCIQLDKDYQCICPMGLRGEHCEINLDDCESSPCLNNASCIDGIGNYTCLCPNGWEGYQCENNIDDCSPNPCQNGGECLDLLNNYKCECRDGFLGSKCEINAYECESNPCLNNGTCFDMENSYKCCCAKGYYGQNCEKYFDVCDIVKCENGGTCFSSNDGFNCTCSPGYDGEYCENNIDDCIRHVCENDGVCIDGIGNATCECPQKFYGAHCEGVLKPEFMLSFPNPSTSNFVELKNTRLLYAITVGFFMRTSFKDPNSRATPVSYSYNIKDSVVDNALTLLDTNNFVLYIHGEAFHTGYAANSDSEWHHYAVTWEKMDGKWSFYVDGKSILNGLHIGESKYMHPGIFILGQEQDTIGGSFSVLEAFAGDITEFNVWDYALSTEEIKQISSSCGFTGNVIPWYTASQFVHGSTVITQQVDKCRDVGTCPEDSCDCFYSKQGKDNSCKYNMGDCSQNICANDRPCIMDEHHSFCNCSSAFEGRYCEYDIDECLQNNGGCEYFCINDIGSYSCGCPDDMILSGDDKLCKETSFCIINEEVYPDGETWISSCQTCNCDHGSIKCEDEVCNKTACHEEETLIMAPGECCPKCVAWSFCVVSPNNTVMTFDTSSYKMDGDCTYTAVEDCIGGHFKVLIQPVQNGSGEINLVIHQDCSKILLTFDGQVFIDGKDIELPFRNEEMTVETNESNIIIWTHSNLHIQWNFTNEVLIAVPITDVNKMCGLCKKIEEYYTYNLGKYTFPERIASGENQCFAVFEDLIAKSSADNSNQLWSSTKVHQLLMVFVIYVHIRNFRS